VGGLRAALLSGPAPHARKKEKAGGASVATAGWVFRLAAD
jgi:hypothetical protein